ncbi:MAG: protein kinase domain-containing protein [Aulosira sp. ZfuVER01]|nr:serine/threonine protein kinase [Aulosira sp. ZfuVER01]MDZ7996395.1 serine/threonine protein kinase [Aulosira sp. DedVER01a]MDZ8054084.1 serine/threonine protein kinase [Aulosira sp. ZfuCHP01]
MIGRLLDHRYEVVELLGKGGFGHTYIALDTRRPGNPTCVVKHLKPVTSDPEFLPLARRLFNREAETLEKLGHNDQIPRLLAYFEENEEFYLVQELIEGQPLAWEMPPGNRWSEEQVIKLLQDVLPILEFIHGHGVIHRDLKPDNLIRRAADNTIVLVDFGAVKQIKSYSLMTPEQLKNDTVAVGTPGYMPSEQGQGRPRPCSDIYALGMTCIQALTGLNPKQLGEDAVSGEILWQHHAQVSNQLASILNKMVRHYFKYRYQSATEALQALSSITNASTPAAVASVVTQVVGHYLKDGYVTATKVMNYLQELAKPCYIPPDNETTSGSTPQPLTAPSTLRASEVQNALSTTATNATQAPSRSQFNLRSLPKSSPKSRLLIGGSAAIAVVAFGIMSANHSQKPSSEPGQNEVKAVANNTNAPEQKKSCLVVTSSSNLRSLSGSGQRKTGKVVKAGTQVTTTGKTEGGWIEISSPEPGWIWKSRTRNSCPAK